MNGLRFMVKGFELRVGDLGFVVSSFGLLGLLDFGPMSFGFILPAGSSVFENLVLGHYAVMEKLGDVVTTLVSFPIAVEVGGPLCRRLVLIPHLTV